MISIKKYLDLDSRELSKFRPPAPEDPKDALIAAYRAALASIGDCSAQVCPSTGADLQKGLTTAATALSKSLTCDQVRQNEIEVEEHLKHWGSRTSGYLRERAGDVKEILVTLARVAESVGERDQRYAAQFNEFTQRLHALAHLEDLPQIRAAVVRGAKDLKTCVDKMEQDSRESMAALQSEVATYQSKLEEAEKQVSRDPLTGLDNRLGIESQLQRRINAARPFCVVMLDLNGFKQVNDTYGHEAGDDLLKQFSAELRAAARATDTVGRWGGDEFVVLLDATLQAAKSHVDRLKKWVFGAYTLRVGPAAQKVQIAASIGVVEWLCGESGKEVLSRADALMYQDKTSASQGNGATTPPPVM